MGVQRSLDEWLSWQATLHPVAMDLGLERVAHVAARLEIHPPTGRVLTVAGTNGKGSCVQFAAAALQSAGLQTGTFTSPHLLRYNERIRLAGREAGDEELIEAFEAIDAARGDDSLTYFEFGTLAAVWLFSRARLDAWILEVGLGGRLDAVNIIDPAVSLISGIGLDHQQWLGDSIEAIAAEKAGIMRPGRPVLYGDRPVPDAIVARAAALGADLRLFGRDFGYRLEAGGWQWWSRRRRLDSLPLPVPDDEVQLRNVSVVLAALETMEPRWPDAAMADAVLRCPPPPGRFQCLQREHQWILDVAHNEQAAGVLAARLARLPPATGTTVVMGLLGDKDLRGFVTALDIEAERWITCELEGERAIGADALARELRGLVGGEVLAGGDPARACGLAARLSSPGARIVVCGSFYLVGPALDWLGWPAEP